MVRLRIAVIHGQAHKGVTYTITHAILQNLAQDDLEIREFFLPKDGPDFCIGCNACFVKGEAYCPSADRVQPIADAMVWADAIIVDTPNYVMEMSGALKNLMDHLAYRWVTHRPHASMYGKVGVAVCSSAGAPAGGVTRSIARQLKWMGCPKVYCLPFTSSTMTVSGMKDERRRRMERKAARLAKALGRKVGNARASLRAKAAFLLMRRMQSSPDAAWNPTDRDWWVENGWTGSARPWRD